MSVNNIGRALERIEIIRSALRWSSQLDRSGIQKILAQMNQVRNELLMLSSLVHYSKKNVNTPLDNPDVSQRRQALLDNDFVFTGIFGENQELLTVLEIVAKAAKTDFPVLIEGESGTGKELLAKVVHANSPRSCLPYVSINCGAIPTNLIESELFGHAKGAFTGADNHRKGKFELAHRGTLFLDEIGELSLDNQVKLLRVLQSGEIQRVGADNCIKVDVRIVAATNKNLYEMSLNGSFREDLYYRIGVVAVTIPPLRERRDEIQLLVDYFLKEAADKIDAKIVRLSPCLKDFLQQHAYRGNIRELQNIVYRITCLADNVGGMRHLPDSIRPVTVSKGTTGNKLPKTLEQVRAAARDTAEEQFLRDNLTRTQGQVSKLAEEIDLNRSYLQSLMKKHGLKSRDFKN